jgi:Tol biopolymer transport system component
MKYLLLIILFPLMVSDQSQYKDQNLLSNHYSGDDVYLLAAGSISTGMGEYSPTFDLVRNELYFMRRTPGVFDYTIYRSKLIEIGWTKPEVTPFSGTHRDAGPYLSPDGNTLYFDSRRPAKEVIGNSINLWHIRRNDAGWGKPELLVIPSSNQSDESEAGVDEFGPAVDSQGTLYFYSFRQPYRAGARYTSKSPGYDQLKLEQSMPDPSANTFVSYLYISGDGNLVIMEGEAKGKWNRDLYCSCKNTDGSWNEPLAISQLNTDANEGGPYLTSDGQYLLFTSNRPTNNTNAQNDNLYIVRAESILEECKALKK